MINDLVDTGEIAAMAMCTRRHATNRIVKRASFPKPVVDLSQKHKLWKREAVAKALAGKR